MISQKRKNKTVVAIFAHPDDEAFGPGGTMAKFAKTHNVYLLCATKGEEGLPSEALAKEGGKNGIGNIREKELITAAKILGIKKVIFLGFGDGTLCNNNYHNLADKIKSHLLKIKPQTVITTENRGVSGHIDHMVVSMVTTFVVIKLKFVKKLMYYCILDEERRDIKNYFIYFPKGYKRDDVDETIDISGVWDQKIKAMRAHKSQKHDGERIIKVLEKLPKEEHFLIFKDR